MILESSNDEKDGDDIAKEPRQYARKLPKIRHLTVKKRNVQLPVPFCLPLTMGQKRRKHIINSQSLSHERGNEQSEQAIECVSAVESASDVSSLEQANK